MCVCVRRGEGIGCGYCRFFGFDLCALGVVKILVLDIDGVFSGVMIFVRLAR